MPLVKTIGKAFVRELAEMKFEYILYDWFWRHLVLFLY